VAGKGGVVGSRVRVVDKQGRVRGVQDICGGDGRGGQRAPLARFALEPGTMARVGPEQHRRVLPGPDGIQVLVLGGRPGAFDAPSWTELGAPPPRAE